MIYRSFRFVFDRLFSVPDSEKANPILFNCPKCAHGNRKRWWSNWIKCPKCNSLYSRSSWKKPNPTLQEKPPLGLLPKRIHDENRLKDIEEAIERYDAQKMTIPISWLIERNYIRIELNHLNKAIKSHSTPHEELRQLCMFQSWLATHYTRFTQSSNEMTDRARRYYKHRIQAPTYGAFVEPFLTDRMKKEIIGNWGKYDKSQDRETVEPIEIDKHEIKSWNHKDSPDLDYDNQCQKSKELFPGDVPKFAKGGITVKPDINWDTEFLKARTAIKNPEIQYPGAQFRDQYKPTIETEEAKRIRISIKRHRKVLKNLDFVNKMAENRLLSKVERARWNWYLERIGVAPLEKSND